MMRLYPIILFRHKKRKIYHLAIVNVLLFVSLTGCGTSQTTATLPGSYASDQSEPSTPTSLPTERVVLTLPTVTITREAELTSTQTDIPACLTLLYEEYAQVEMISPHGVRVLVDVYDPGLLSTPASEEDILLTTHTHWDHVNIDFSASFPGIQLMTKSGIIELVDVIAQGIPSGHNAGDPPVNEGGTNYIYLVEMGELRVAHFGDIGQEALTDEQLDLLGNVDIAITQLANPYSDMSAENKKGVLLMEQVGPKLIIPTHINLDVLKLSAGQWAGFYSDNPSVTICLSDLPDQTRILLLGDAAVRFAERLSFEMVDW